MIKKLQILIGLFFSKQNHNIPEIITTNLFGNTAKWLCFVFFVFQLGYGQSGCNVVKGGEFNSSADGSNWTLPESSNTGWFRYGNEAYIDVNSTSNISLKQNVTGLLGSSLTLTFKIKGQNADRLNCNTNATINIKLGGITYMTIVNPSFNTTNAGYAVITTDNITTPVTGTSYIASGFPIAVGRDSATKPGMPESSLGQGTITLTIPSWAGGVTADLEFVASSSTSSAGTGNCNTTTGGDDWLIDDVKLTASDPTDYMMTGVNSCAGTNTAMGLNNSQVGVNYQLKRNGTTNVGTAVAGTGTNISFGTQSTAGTYTVMAVVGTTECKVMSGSVVINPTPTLTGAARSGTACLGTGNLINLTGLLPNSTSTISYTIANIAQTPITGVVANGSGAGSFTSTALTVLNSGQTLRITGVTTTSVTPNCTANFTTITTTLSVSTVPAVISAGSNQVQCNNATFTLAGTAAPIGTSGLWSVVSGTATITTPSSNTSGVTGVPAGSSATLRWTITNGSTCTARDEVVLTNYATPTVSNAGLDISNCNSASFTLAGNSPTIGTGVWSVVSGTATITTPTSNTSAVTGITAGNSATLRWTITNGACTSTDDVVLTNYATATVASAGADQTNSATCGLTSVTLNGNNPTDGTGAWSIVSGTGGTIASPSTRNSTFSGTAGSTYTLRWTITNGVCSSADDVVITFNQSPTVSNAGPDQTGIATCGLTSVTLAGNAPTVGTGVWSIVSGTGGTIANPSSPTSTFTGTAGSTYTLRWTISNSPCTSSTDDVVITFNVIPATPTGSEFQTFCAAGSPTVANLTATGTAIKWYDALIGGNQLTAATPLINGNHYYASQTSGCESTTRLDVTVMLNATPVITPNKVDETCSSSNNGTISPTFSGGLANVRYIRLTQKFDNPDAWLQVAEINAFEIFTGQNVALSSNGASATASSVYLNNAASFGPALAIDGNNGNMYHSNTPNRNEYLEISLASPKNIDYLRIYNRNDAYAFRGQNMLLELLDNSHNVVYAKTVDLRGVSGTNVIDVNVLDVTWSDAATTLNRTGLDSGSYTINYADAAGCSVSMPINITSINNAPAITAISSPALLCQDDSLNPTVPTVTNNGSAVTASGWEISTTSGGSTYTALSLPYTVAYADNGKNVRYYAINGCGRTNSNIVAITVNQKPTAPTVGIITHLNCTTNTGSVELRDLPTGDWTINQTGDAAASYGNTIPNTTNRTISGLSAGSYTFTVTNSDGCTSPVSTTVTIFNNSNTWNGSSWSRGVPPNATMNVVIAAVTPNSPFTTDLVGCALTINSDVVAIVPSGVTLTITNEVTVNGSLTFENNASLVQINNVNNNSGSIIYKRDSQPMKNFDFTYWSSPVEGQTLYNLSPNTLWDKYQSYSGSGWKIETSTNVMQPGIGYIIRVPKPFAWPDPTAASYVQPVQFIGKPNNGNITSSQYLQTGKYYLIGNPYPSAIHADDFLKNSHNDPILGGTIYFWTHNTAIKIVNSKLAYVSDDYASYNLTGGVASAPSDPNHAVGTPAVDNGKKPTGFIAAGQSFFVKAEGTAEGYVEFNNSMRYGGTNNTQFFKPGKTSKSAAIEKHRLWLNLTNTGGAFKQTLIGYVDGATNGYDTNFDGITYDGNSYIDFYSISESSNLTIQGRALPFSDSDVVPLGYRSTIAGDFTIAIDEADGSLSTQRIYLEDKDTGTINELTAKNYTFTTKAGTFKNRFVLRYKNATLGTGDFETENDAVWVVAQNKTITVNSVKENIDKVFIYDVSGKELYSKDRVSNLQLVLQNQPFAQQVLLVKVVLENGCQTTKKVIFK
ncbi:T9SS sorting signal type C domain-containing protein [Flavobacterium hibisci]|uniref:T9SS sorting signal type C domain-containing protein n=1 Tax=Flavobacterium hibisci TaxID=1914462 RepID=UPI001CBDD8AD|nr:T9SS sorting signal type C domain-containing protein [Flavobacterium hibisci]MBZ4043342.1 T9SS sorting signal type C domain-containing protein [Flavobacterium hibisci]